MTDRRRADEISGGAPVNRALVIEYLAALDARRSLATDGATSASGQRLRGTALARVFAGAQRRLDAAETALRDATR